MESETKMVVPQQVQDQVLAALRNSCHLGEFFSGNGKDIGTNALSFCTRIGQAIAFAERFKQMFCGSATTTPFCARLQQGIDAAKALQATFCELPAARSESFVAADSRCSCK